MDVGLGVLGLPPSVLWSLTPREFEAALRGRGLLATPGLAGVPRREDLTALLKSFPDQPMGASS